jgi:putative SOS response-associated peptidase YedK
MCGRVIQYRSPQEYAALLGLHVSEGSLPDIPAHYNGAPGQDFLIVWRHPEANHPVFSASRWGLIPVGSNDPKIAWKLINAPAETVVVMAPFRAAYRYRRCLIPVDGFYEWKKLGVRERQPYAIGMTDGLPFTLAGLWENWKDENGQWVRTFAIITTESSDLLVGLNSRMPLIVAPEDRQRWIGDEEHPWNLLKRPPPESMTKWPVSTQVNSPTCNERTLLERVAVAG